MFGISLVYRYMTLVSLVISVFLLGFLLLGCVASDSTYSDIYLAQMLFNVSSELFPSSNTTSLLIKTNYLGMCVTEGSSTICSATSNITLLEQYTEISVLNTSLNLADLCKLVSDVCHPRILAATILLALVVMIICIYCAVPALPKRKEAKQISCGLAFINVLLWALGSMLQQQTVTGATKFIGSASLGLVRVTLGKRAEAITWTAFAFLIVAALGLLVGVVREKWSEHTATKR